MSAAAEGARIDPRNPGAAYYDLQPFPDDVPFYRALIGDGRPSLLELGCGTGRVMLALADLCASATGVEASAEMLGRARAKGGGGSFVQGDVTDFDLGRTFDLILAPYRVFQALDSDREVAGMLAGIRRHLAPGGSCVLTMFMPMYEPDTLRARWATREETVDWDVEVDGERIVASDRRPRMDTERLVLYPELVYRRYRGDRLVDEAVMPIVMRCWYPDQIASLLAAHAFRITGRWGGYHGEVYGEGPELVVRFDDPDVLEAGR